MSRARGFRGKIARAAVPALCGGCHADAALIHKFKPQQRVDQLAQYKTSVHGKRLAAGDTAVANCVDCHGVHDIHEVKDPRSPVHPLRLPETCATCHADRDHMAKYPIETTQFEEYRTSVHWEALAKRGDLSAPSCASCHGNHGATPPAVSSVGAVCGTCHVLIEDLFKKSPHQGPFETMGSGACVVCHGNHAIQKPGIGMLAGDSSVCTQCHEAGSSGALAAADMTASLVNLGAALDRSDDILNRARRSGMEVAEAQMQQMEAREQLVKARVAVHAFDIETVRAPAREGLAIAARTYSAGEEAMKERDTRRYGLALSLIFIIITMVGLRIAIRSIESGTPTGSESARD
jgi:predicted CXXCH cytochrome family protein